MSNPWVNDKWSVNYKHKSGLGIMGITVAANNAESAIEKGDEIFRKWYDTDKFEFVGVETLASCWDRALKGRN